MNQTNYHVKVWLDKQMLRAETMSKHMFSEIDSQLVVKLREREGKKGRPRKVTQRSFIDGRWWMVDILSLKLYTKFG